MTVLDHDDVHHSLRLLLGELVVVQKRLSVVETQNELLLRTMRNAARNAENARKSHCALRSDLEQVLCRSGAETGNQGGQLSSRSRLEKRLERVERDQNVLFHSLKDGLDVLYDQASGGGMWMCEDHRAVWGEDDVVVRNADNVVRKADNVVRKADDVVRKADDIVREADETDEDASDIVREADETDEDASQIATDRSDLISPETARYSSRSELDIRQLLGGQDLG